MRRTATAETFQGGGVTDDDLRPVILGGMCTTLDRSSHPKTDCAHAIQGYGLMSEPTTPNKVCRDVSS